MPPDISRESVPLFSAWNSALEERPAMHLIGVCGAGMRSLASLLHEAGYLLSGSDQRLPDGPLLDGEHPKFPIAQGHHAAYLPIGTRQVIYSEAVPPDNPERVAARERGIPEISYAVAVGELMRGRTGVCIAGTHGKTTTTAMLQTILEHGGRAPLAIHGGERLQSAEGGTAVHDASIVLTESCEYRQSFLHHHPKLAAVLSVDSDHFDCYRNDAELLDAYRRFVQRIPADGYLLTATSGNCRQAAAACGAPVETFGDGCECDWQALDIRPAEGGSRCRVFHRGEFVLEMHLPIPGRHNVFNALAATALAIRLGVKPADIQVALAEFAGLKRRFERVGTWKGVTRIDDYAHLPQEIAATLAAVRECYPHRRVLCAFQPHQVSRTLALLPQFAAALAAADRVWVAPVFAAREAADVDILTPSQQLAEAIDGRSERISSPASLDHLLSAVDDEARPGDVFVTMGAGDIGRIQYDLTRRLRRHHPPRRTAGPVYLAQAGRAGTVLYHPAG